MHSDKIISLKNPKIKSIVGLREHYRRSDYTLIEGKREVLQALAAGIEVKEIFICPDEFKKHGIDIALPKFSSLRVPVYETTPEVFAKISYGDRREGILAVGKPRILSLKDFQLSPNPFLVILEGIEKPGNLGAILRTSVAAGVDGVILSDPKTDVYNPNVIRASLGTVFSVQTAVSSKEETLKFLRTKGIRIIASFPSAETSYTQINFKEPLCLVVGSEEKGLSSFWMKQADGKIKIPMFGKIDSLNVSVSAAILLYEVRRQRG